MTFYQELQLSPAGSKSYIASFENPKDKLKHTGIYFYRNHRKIAYKRTFKSLFQEFHLSSVRTRWQLRLTVTVSGVMPIASLLNVPKAMWFGIAAMSVCVPFRNDMKYRVKYRAPGNILGAIMFLAAYWILPEGAVSYMGILGGIGTGLSASYGWQTVFNAFSALAGAVQVLGLPYAIIFRIFNNAFGSIYAWLFDKIFEPILSALDHIIGSLKAKAQSDIKIME